MPRFLVALLTLAVLAVSARAADHAARLKQLRSEVELSAEELETLRAADPLAALPDEALKPYFKDRDSALDALYRTMAVFDYSDAARDPKAWCDPRARRDALFAARDGLFFEKNGHPSAWLLALLGHGGDLRAPDAPAARGRVATPREYELLRLRLRRLTRALDAAPTSRLKCERAGVLEALARARSAHAVPEKTAAAAEKNPAAASVLLIVSSDGKDLRARGAGVAVKTEKGVRVLTDAGLVDAEKVVALTRASTGSLAGAALAVERRASGAAVAALDGEDQPPVLTLASSGPAAGELVRAVAHLRGAGSWTETQGLVTNVGKGAFLTDAAVNPDMRGGAVLDADGKLVGLLIQPKPGAPLIALDAARLRAVLDGTEPEQSPVPALSGYALGTGAILTAAAPFDAALLQAPGSAAVAAGLPSGTGGVCWDGGCGGGMPSFRPSGSAGGPSGGSAPAPQVDPQTAQMMGAMAQALGGLIGNMLVAPPPQPQGTRFFGAPVSPGATAKPPEKKPKPELVGLDLMVSPSEAKPGQSVTVIATLVMYDANNSGEPYSRSGYTISFSADPAGSLVYDQTSAVTDGGGHATVRARVADFSADSDLPSTNGGENVSANLNDVGARPIEASFALENPGVTALFAPMPASLHAVGAVQGITGGANVGLIKEPKADQCANVTCPKGQHAVLKAPAGSVAAPSPGAPQPPSESGAPPKSGEGGEPPQKKDDKKPKDKKLTNASAEIGAAASAEGGSGPSDCVCVDDDGKSPNPDDKSFSKANDEKSDENKDSSDQKAKDQSPSPTVSVDDVLSDANLEKDNKSKIYRKSGGIDRANAEFDSLTKGQPVKDQGDGVRSAKLSDGSTISVRTFSSEGPSGTGSSPTIQINPPSGKPIKIRYGP